MKDKLVTLFGGGGFLGRYVAQALLNAGARVRVAQRDPRQAWYLKPLGGLGQTQFVAADVTRADSVARAVAGSDAVVNLVGILKGRFDAIHVTGAANIAAAARDVGASALVHVSAIGADPKSPSAYGRSKGEGEARVHAAFPEAIILRPSTVFGPEDQFVNRFAGLIRALPVTPVIGGDAKFQPVYVGDVARAVAAAVADPKAYAGRVFELGGPEVITLAELNRRIAAWIGKAPRFAPIPDAIAGQLARFTGWAPGAPITADQWLMLQQGAVASEGSAGLAAFGITPTPLAAVAPGWLVQYRRLGRFATKTA
jgi:NADH dehydrogenase